MNFQNLKTRFIAQIDARPAIKYVLLIQSCGFLLALIGPISDALVLVPSNIFRLHLWRVVTNLFLENNLIVIAWSSYAFYQFLMYILPNWPLEEIVKYTIIVQLMSNFSLVISTLLLYIFTDVVYPFYYAPIYGTSALAMAALVALKQFLPDTVLLSMPYGRLKNGHLPMATIAASILLWLFWLLRGTIPFQLIFALQISWTYLRFFQSRGGIGECIIGDCSDHFTWASFFPRRLQPAALLLGRLTFRSLNRLGILRRMMGKEHLERMEEHNLQMDALDSVKVADAGAAVLAPESWDAERKRQKALRILNERLAAASTPQKQRGQEMVEDGRKTASTGHFDTEQPYTFPHHHQFAPPPPPIAADEEETRSEFDSSTGAEVQFYLDQRSSSDRETASQPKQFPTA